jgi:predicted N-acyltransferase
VTADRTGVLRTWDGVGEPWDELNSASDLHLAGRWLQAVEASRRDQPVYVVRRDGAGAFQGAVVGYLVAGAANGNTEGLSQFTRADCLLASALRGAGALVPDLEAILPRLMPDLLCGGWTLANSGLALSKTLASDERAPVAAELVAGIARAAAEVGAQSVCFPYVEQRNHELRDALRAHGFLEFPAASHYALDVTWSSFDEYTGLRRTIRQELAKLGRAGVAFRVAPLDEAIARAVVPLALGTVEKNQGTATTAQMLDRLLMMARFGGQIIVAEHANVIRGFGVILEWQERLYARMVGFDYEFQGSLPLYFGVMYEQIRYAIARGLRRIEYAIAGDRAKILRGATPFPQVGYVLVRDPADAARLAAALARAREFTRGAAAGE